MKRQNFVILLFYFLVNLPFLFNNGIYLDSWVQSCMSDSELIEHAFISGKPWAGYLHAFIFPLAIGTKAVYFYRLIPFVSLLAASFLFNKILKNVKEIDRSSRLILTLFFIVFPIASSIRIFVSVYDYAICYFLFFLGFYLFTKRAGILIRLAGLFSFAAAFLTASFLPFYSIVIVYMVYEAASGPAPLPGAARGKDFIAAARSLCRRNFDFIVLPVVFWLVKSHFFKPYGYLAGYNKISPRRVLAFPLYIPRMLYNNLIEPVRLSLLYFFNQDLSIIFLDLLIFSLCFFTVKKYYRHSDLHPASGRRNLSLFLFGLFSFAMAAFPYVAVTKVPSLYNMDCRHQLLFSPGAAFLVYYGLRLIIKQQKLFVFIVSFALALFSAGFINNAVEFQKDWYRQLAFTRQLAGSDIIKDHSTFLFVDNTLPHCLLRRQAYPDYMGKMALAFGDTKRYGQDYGEFMSWAEALYRRDGGFEHFSDNFIYHRDFAAAAAAGDGELVRLRILDDYSPALPEYIVTVEHGPRDLDGFSRVVRLRIQEAFDRDVFNREILSLVGLNAEAISPGFEELVRERIAEESAVKTAPPGLWRKIYAWIKYKGLIN